MTNAIHVYLFCLIANIPYGGVGERSISACLKLNRGTCSTKHALLGEILGAYGYSVKYHMGRVDLNKFSDNLNLDISVEPGTIDYHNFISLKINSTWVKLDATFGINEERLGLPTNSNWDGYSDCDILFPVTEYWEVEEIFKSKETAIAELPRFMKNNRATFFKKFSDRLQGLELL